MLMFHERRRAVLVEKLPDLANVAAGALIFWQLLGGQDVSPIMMPTGLFLWFLLMGLAVVLVGGAGVTGAIDLAHAASPDGRDDLVRPETSPGTEIDISTADYTGLPVRLKPDTT
ncbi:MAG: hypothetical protein A3H95_03250 [Acidobacteria bacterium RIFCSPLOWO2_02_FULL_64_15]|nr:MAG: hypothetical protein A3H95_03250 [Acidobacteria bacterium RIFCSPLOWO2_02_FULL_64_15]